MDTVIEGDETPIEYLEKTLKLMKERAEEINSTAYHLERDIRRAFRELEVIKKEMAEKGE